MTDREHVHPLTLAVLDLANVYGHNEPYTSKSTPLGRKSAEWNKDGSPLLTPRASAVLEAVEKTIHWDGGVHGRCGECAADTCSGCSIATVHYDTIRRAWKEKP
jgi:hypothetical protein